MADIGVRELKAQLSQQLKRVQRGSRLTITDRGKPIVVASPESPAAVALAEIAERVVEAARTRGGAELPILRG